MAGAMGEIKTRVIPSAEAKLKLAQLIDDVYTHGTRYIIQRFDTPRVAVISLADYQRLLESERAGTPVLRETAARYDLGEEKTPEEIDRLLGTSPDAQGE